MPNMRLYLFCCFAAAALPFVPRPALHAAATGDEFPGWPATFEGRSLVSVALSERDLRFAQDFPGHIAAFNDGRRQFLMRWISTPTRKLHPSAHCFRGAGYTITHEPLRTGPDGQTWSCFTAAKDGVSLRVHEQVRDGEGSAWPDVSAWYWSALLGKSTGPWWSVVVIE